MEYCETTGERCLSQKEAGNIIRLCHTSYRHRKYGTKVPSRSYFCKYCHSYHVTHYKNRDYVREDVVRYKGQRKYNKDRKS